VKGSQQPRGAQAKPNLRNCVDIIGIDVTRQVEIGGRSDADDTREKTPAAGSKNRPPTSGEGGVPSTPYFAKTTLAVAAAAPSLTRTR
jgi:hypothetical protein